MCTYNVHVTRTYVCTYVRTHIHIHTFYVHTYILCTYIHFMYIHTYIHTTLCTCRYIIMEMLIYVLLLYSHFVKHHEIRKETPRILWQYGNILSDGIPFIIISSQELQCQYGHPKNYNSKVNIIIIVISVAYNLSVNNRDLLMIMIHMYGKPESLHMAECDCCQNWYHRGCISIPDTVFKPEKYIGFVAIVMIKLLLIN